MSLNSSNPLPTRPLITMDGKVLDKLYQAWFNAIQVWLGPIGQSGTTAARPTKSLYVSLQYFDTTLGKPVFVKQVTPSIVWVDATGSVV